GCMRQFGGQLGTEPMEPNQVQRRKDYALKLAEVIEDRTAEIERRFAAAGTGWKIADNKGARLECAAEELTIGRGRRSWRGGRAGQHLAVGLKQSKIRVTWVAAEEFAEQVLSSQAI